MPQDPKGFQLCKEEGPLTALWQYFWGQLEKLEAIERGEDIKESTGQRLYVFKQYVYLRDRTDAFRARDTNKQWKPCVIVTGTPGIGKGFYLLGT
jgi:hypothetical protein